MHLNLFPMRRLIFTMIFLTVSLALPAQGFRAVVIPVEFSNLSFTDIQYVNSKVEVASRYFDAQFSHVRSFTFDVLPTVHLPKLYSWYGANSSSAKDIRLSELIRTTLNSCSVDFSIYDNDNDGYIDNVYIVAAGPSESDGSGADYLWPQQGYLSERREAFQIGGKTVDCYCICSELSASAVFCHEFAHIFGLMDMYDTDGNGSGGTSKGLWQRLSPMDNGVNLPDGYILPNFSAVELDQLGLGYCVPFSTGKCTLKPINQYKEYIRIESDTVGEYYLLECRDNEGWDWGLGGSGLVIYHIDRSGNNAWHSDLYKRNLLARERWELNQVNCRPDYPCAQVVCAVPGTNDFSKIFFPQPGHDSFSSDTDPSFRFWNGSASQYAISDIKIEEDGSATFKILSPISDLSTQVFQDAIIVNWSTDPEMDLSHCSVYWYKDDTGGGVLIGTKQATSQGDGSYYYIIENLEPSSDYTVVIRAVCNDGSTYSQTIKLRTKGRQKGARPFIYLNSMSRRDDGSFYAGDRCPLRVYNLDEPAELRWYFNNSRVRPESDAYWILTESGTLRAEIWYEDGSVEIITRKLTVR